MQLVALENDIGDCEYVEPFAGGAAVALSMLYSGFARTIHINDLSRPVYAFWHCALDRTDEFCERIQRLRISMREWHLHRKVYLAADEADPIDLGVSTLFLNRTNRSGILHGGVIGGKEQAGEWTLDVRFNKADLIDRIRKLARHRHRIRVYNEDAAEFLEEVLPTFEGRPFVYLDPPYYQKGQDLYDNHYAHEDHEALRDRVLALDADWIVSYDDLPEIVGLYDGCQSLHYRLHYVAQGRYRGQEVLFASDNLSLPAVETPVKIPDRVVARWPESLDG